MRKNSLPACKFLLPFLVLFLLFVFQTPVYADNEYYRNEYVTEFPFEFQLSSQYVYSADFNFICSAGDGFELTLGLDGSDGTQNLNKNGIVTLIIGAEFFFDVDVFEGDLIHSFSGQVMALEDDYGVFIQIQNVVANSYNPTQIAAMALLADLGIMPLALGTIYETEPNNTQSTYNLIYDDYDVYGKMYPTGDVDWFRVMFSQNGLANFWLGNKPTGCTIKFGLYNSGGTLLATSSTNSSNNQEQLYSYAVTGNVWYYIRVYSNSGYSNASYYLFRTRLLSPPTVTTNTNYDIIPPTTARVYGSFSNNEQGTLECGFEYGTTSSNLNNSHIAGSNNATSSNFNYGIGPLVQGYTYYYRAYVKNLANVKYYGTTRSFLMPGATLTVNPSALTIESANGSNGSFMISSNTAWNIYDKPSWLNLSSSAGNNDATIKVTANSANTSSSTRVATLRVSGGGIDKYVTVTQSGTVSLTVNPSTLTIDSSNSSNGSFAITSNVTWTITGRPSWLNLSSNTGSNNATVTVTANSANSSAEPRSANLTVSGGGQSKTVTVTQRGSVFLEVSIPSITIGSANNSNASFAITSNTTWTISNKPSWLNLSSSSGSNNATITVTANSANATSNPRVAILTVSGGGISRNVTVTQSGVGSIYLEVNPSSLALEQANGSKRSFTVTSNTTWTITGKPSWFDLSISSGSNNATIVVTANSANASSADRSATLTVSGGGLTKYVNVAQYGTAFADNRITLTRYELNTIPNSSDNRIIVMDAITLSFGLSNNTNGWFPTNSALPPLPNGWLNTSLNSSSSTDHRTWLPNTRTTPYSAIAYLDINKGYSTNGNGTGFMVSDRIMLSAAHVFRLNPSFNFYNVEVCPARNAYYDTSNQIVSNIPMTVYPKYIYIPADFAGTDDLQTNDLDYSIVVFDQSVGNSTGWFGLTTANQPGYLTISGYPGGKSSFDYEKPIGSIWTHTGPTYGATSIMQQYSIDATQGQSGAPIYNSLNQVSAIYVQRNLAYEPTRSVGRRIDSRIAYLADHFKNSPITSIAFSQSAYLVTGNDPVVTVEADLKDAQGNIIDTQAQGIDVDFILNDDVINKTGTFSINDLVSGLNAVNAKAYLSGDIILETTAKIPYGNPKTTSIEFTPTAYATTIPVSGSITKTVSAQVIDQYDDTFPNCVITYSLDQPYSGVSVNSSTGVVTIQSTVEPGIVIIRATYGSLPDAFTSLTISRAASIPTSIAFAQNSYSIEIPDSGSTVDTVAAQIKDQYGRVMSWCSPTYSLQNPYSGISVNSTTGEVTIQSTAAIGAVNIVASYGLLSYMAPLTLTISSSEYTIVFYENDEICDYNYYEDAYQYYVDVNSTDTAYLCAYVLDSTDAIVTWPELVSIEYSSDSGVVNSSGIFTLDELEIGLWWNNYNTSITFVTVTATLSDNTVLQGLVCVEAIAIKPRR